jgi:hypothetical protein
MRDAPPSDRFSALMEWGYFAWFLVAPALLGFLAGWQVDRASLRAPVAGRVLFTLIGLLLGALVGVRVALPDRLRRPPHD